MTTVQICENQTEWDDKILGLGGHPLQLWGWGEVKAAHNWKVSRVTVTANGTVIGAAQLLIRPLPKPFQSMVYIARGPACQELDREVVLKTLAHHAKTVHNAVVITVEPDWTNIPSIEGWKPSNNTILIPRTLILDLKKTEEELQSVMAKKTRQYIRKSANEDIEIRRLKSREELKDCLEIYKQTALRAGFALHEDQYYYDIFEMMDDHSVVMAAFHQGQPLAFLWLAISEQTAFELYGGMNDLGQQLRSNYALKWQTIQLMKKWGIERYDFNGLLNDGVSTFKQSFASHEDLLVGTYDKPLSPLYIVWSKGLPLAKKIVRKIKNR